VTGRRRARGEGRGRGLCREPAPGCGAKEVTSKGPELSPGGGHPGREANAVGPTRPSGPAAPCRNVPGHANPVAAASRASDDARPDPHTHENRPPVTRSGAIRAKGGDWVVSGNRCTAPISAGGRSALAVTTCSHLTPWPARTCKAPCGTTKTPPSIGSPGKWFESLPSWVIPASPFPCFDLRPRSLAAPLECLAYAGRRRALVSHQQTRCIQVALHRLACRVVRVRVGEVARPARSCAVSYDSPPRVLYLVGQSGLTTGLAL
jgi:hypothetical protein